MIENSPLCPPRARWWRWFGARAKRNGVPVAPLPAPVELVIFDCPRCGHEMRAEDDRAGQASVCPECDGRVIIPPRAMARCNRRPVARLGTR